MVKLLVMERAYEFRKQRNELAEKIKEQRAKGASKEAQKILEDAKAAREYKENSALHKGAKVLSKENLAVAAQLLEREDDPEKWEVVDLSSVIPPEVKKFIDAELLSDLNGLSDEGSERIWNSKKQHFGVDLTSEPYKQGKQIAEKRAQFIDSITDGRFSNTHNVTHVVSGQGLPSGVGVQFNRYSGIIPSEEQPNRPSFWLASRKGNDYVSYVSKPVVILSPQNLAARAFFEQQTNPNPKLGRDWRIFLDNFMKDNEMPDPEDYYYGPGFEIPLKESYQKSALEGKGCSWMDIADCIVDLKAEKMWIRKYSDGEKAAVEADIEAYRSGQKKI